MRCHDTCENLSAYIDGMLDLADASLVEQHLESCPDCKSEYDDLLATVELVRELPQVELPPGFRDELKKRLVTAGGLERAPKPVTSRLFGRRWMGMVAAAAVIFITIGVTALWYNEGMLPFPGFGGKVAGESDLAQNQVADRVEVTSEPDANMKALKPADGVGELRMESDPGAEDSTYSGVQEDTEAPADLDLQLRTGIPRDDTGTLMDAGETPSSVSAVPESEKKEEREPLYSITALNDAEMAARDAAPQGMGSGPSQLVEYSLILQVDDRQKTIELVSNAVAKHGGFVDSQQGQSNKYMLVTVPFYNTQTLIEEIGQLGTITDRQSIEKDMSTKIKQLENNISELKAQEKYLVAQLQNQADKAVEKELAKVREQITGLQAELATVNTSIMMSKVELTLVDR